MERNIGIELDDYEVECLLNVLKWTLGSCDLELDGDGKAVIFDLYTGIIEQQIENILRPKFQGETLSNIKRTIKGVEFKDLVDKFPAPKWDCDNCKDEGCFACRCDELCDVCDYQEECLAFELDKMGGCDPEECDECPDIQRCLDESGDNNDDPCIDCSSPDPCEACEYYEDYECATCFDDGGYCSDCGTGIPDQDDCEETEYDQRVVNSTENFDLTEVKIADVCDEPEEFQTPLAEQPKTHWRS